ncbi:hypothetical protein TPHA_0H01540 [Tetrapisispora phaffii CBS 4417]|uniref:Importin N-terminal domain-containing protein n=1 Tax=Tetrapisispora phaffii (strain ATCC 24235 / CBS 4417 / NBRC 1672 / NRRL Y-8282 / UCD 70-5) TaxID=1071381 RepID=G8BX56_TETPH|nr:hypothetical protein TPHA_0H01540 [Tetrapisispora phaffii CBS 4417]CCE64360.1 hypothetical protein TPHA_0H01540 [Tetrapisispora phaffii CBS 4417]
MDSSGASQVISALELIYEPKSTNEQRLEAQKFLDQVKLQDESPYWGYDIAINNQDNHILKYFGLNMINDSIQHKWISYDDAKKNTVRQWIIELNLKISDKDPRYIKEKLAFLWVEVAKRVWGEVLKDNTPSSDDFINSWVDMDSSLNELWNIGNSSRELTLIIFRILFEDVFLLDDLIVLKRMTIIQPLCVMIVCPMDVFSKRYKFNENWKLFKFNENGWFSVWANELYNTLDMMQNTNHVLNDNYNDQNANYVIRLLETLKTCLNWPLSDVIIRTNILDILLKCFLSNIPKAQSTALDAIHILLTRPYNNEEHHQEIINKLFSNMDLLSQLYDNLQFNTSVDGVDDVKYPILKKYVDMISCLYSCIFKLNNSEELIDRYLKLVMKATRNDSLIVSGLTLDLWCACLRNDDCLPLLENGLIPELLSFSAGALIYYEQIDGHISKEYVDIDFQSTSEFQSFCSTYRKRIRDIIRLISCVKVDFTNDWLNNRLNEYFSSPPGQLVLNSTFLDTKSEPYLGALSQLMIIECFINGCIRWKIWYPNGEDYDEKLDDILGKLQVLSNQLIALNIRVPLLLKKQIQNFALFLTMLKDNVIFTLLEKIIISATMDYPNVDLEERNDEADAVRDLRYACGIEINRMALLMPESLKSIFPELENVIAKIMPNLSYHEKISFKSFLLTIILKSSLDNKEERFSAIVDPELLAWSDKSTVMGLSDLPWFMERLGIVKISEYFQKRGIKEDSDLLTIPIDDEGKQLKQELTKHWQTLFPVRATRMFIHYSMQNIKKEEDFRLIQELWRPRIVPILPYIMRLLYQLQSYHDPANWKELPNVVQKFVEYSTVERFWEAGTSNKSKDEFIDEHLKAMQTLRDFADSVGHIVRYTREYVLLVISGISFLGSVFYDDVNAPNLLIDSIAIYNPQSNEISPGVSTHGWKHILNVAIRPILRNCPDSSAPGFMKAFLPKFFGTLDVLITEKWSTHMHADMEVVSSVDEDEITDEIMEENLLRQFTSVTVRILIDCVGQGGTNTSSSKSKFSQHQLKMRKIIFEDVSILAPFLKLLNHLMSVKDGKCSFNSILIMKVCLSEVLINNGHVDEFFTHEVMKNLLLNILCNSAYKDSFSEALYIFTVLFLTLIKEYDSTRIFLIGISNGYNISNLYEQLRNVDNYKGQRSLMIEYIEWVKNSLNINEDEGTDRVAEERRRKEKREATLQKANDRLVNKNKESGDILDDPNTEDAAFGTLFQ